MADGDDSDSKMSVINPKNLLNGVTRMFGGSPDDDSSGKSNQQGELLWMTFAGYILGNSVGTNNTLKGGTRIHLGPVYLW